MSHLFISHARREAVHAERLERDLRSRGYTTWRDMRNMEESIDLTGGIEQAIRDASHVIACLTPDVERRADSFVRRELHYALGRDKMRRQEHPPRRLPIIPIVFPGGELPVNISTWNAIRIEREEDYPRALEELLARLRDPRAPVEEASYEDPPELVSYLRQLHEWTSTTLEERVHTMLMLSAIDAPHAVSGGSVGQILLRFAVSPVMAGPRRPPPAAAVTSFASFTEAFHRHGGRLLLLGAPGAGKTTTLLAFARDTAVARLSDPSKPVPVLASIQYWDPQTPVPVWAQAQVQGLHLEKYPLLYLLDGLDELGGERPVDPEKPEGEQYDPRALFLQALKEQLPHAPLVLTSRIADYEQVGEKADLSGAVTLQPLSDAQIHEYLLARGQSELWKALEADTTLKDMMRTPLLLALLTVAFAPAPGGPAPDLRELDEARIFDCYIQRRFEHEAARPEPLPFNEATTRLLLGELALEMSFLLKVGNHPLAPLLEHSREEFLHFGQRMHFLQKAVDGTVQFIHGKLRDYCVLPLTLELLLNASSHHESALICLSLEAMGKIALPALSQAMRSSQYHVREQVIPRLMRIRDPATIPGLLIALQDQSIWMNDMARMALLDFGPKIVPLLLRELHNEDLGMREAACTALALFDAVIPEMIFALSDRDGAVRARAARVLGKVALAVLEDLMTALRNHAADAEKAAAGALLKPRYDEAVPGLLAALNDDNGEVRAQAAVALGVIGHARSIPALIHALQDPLAAVQIRALLSLGWMKAVDAIEAVHQALKHTHDRVRKAAAITLVRIGDPKCRCGILAALRHETDTVRWTTLQALRRFPNASNLRVWIRS